MVFVLGWVREEQGSEGARERGSEGARERGGVGGGSEGVSEQGGEGARFGFVVFVVAVF